MLGKLMRYEIKATGRYFLPLYGLLLLLAVFDRLLSGIAMPRGLFRSGEGIGRMAWIFWVTLWALIVILIIAVCVCTVVLIASRFYKTMARNEGYLTHTLPVSTAELLWSKAIVGMMWIVCSALVLLAALSVLFVGTRGWRKLLWIVFAGREFHGVHWGGSQVALLLQALLWALVGSLHMIFLLYASVAIGQLFNKHKIVGSFAAFFGINMLANALSALFSAPVVGLMDRSLRSGRAFLSVVNGGFFWTILWTAALTAVLYFVTWYIFKNRLNLE